MNLLKLLTHPVFAQDDYCQRHPDVCFPSGGDIVGRIKNPISNYGDLTSGGLILFLSNILRLVFVAAGIYALLNFIIAGYMWMNAGGDVKMTTAAWNRIWQTLFGLIIIVGSFAMAALFGQLIFGNPGFILNPTIYGPGK